MNENETTQNESVDEPGDEQQESTSSEHRESSSSEKPPKEEGSSSAASEEEQDETPDIDASVNEEREREAREADGQIEGYPLVPEEFKEIAEGYRADAVRWSQAANIPPAEAEVMLHIALGSALEAVARDANAVLAPGQVAGVDLSRPSECRAFLRSKFGQADAAFIEREAIKAFRRLPRELQEELDTDHGTGELLTNSPGLLIALAMHGLGWTRQSKENAAKEMAKLEAKGRGLDQKEKVRLRELTAKKQRLSELEGQLPPAEERELNTLQFRGKPLSAFELETRRTLRHILSRGKSGDHPGLADAAKAKGKPAKSVSGMRRDALQKELREIRLDPGYTDRSAPNHRVLQERVHAIYSELHPDGR